MSDALDRFVYQAVLRGGSEDSTKPALLSSSWEAGEVDAALASHRGIAVDPPRGGGR